MTIKFLFLIQIIFKLFNAQNKWEHFPEDYSSLDYLTQNNNNEIYLVSYYPYNSARSTTIEYDYRNGIILYPLYKEEFFKDDRCGSVNNNNINYFFQAPSNEDDNEWSTTSMNQKIFPPRDNLNKFFFYSDNKINFVHIDPKELTSSSYTSLNIRKFGDLSNNENITFNYYIWISLSNTNINNLKIGCISHTICDISSNHINYNMNFEVNNMYQIFFQYQKGKFSFESQSFYCDPKDGKYELIIYNNHIRIHQIKITYEILNDISCSSDDFCPPGTRCNNGVCEKCDGRYSICKDISINNGEYVYSSSSSILECSRFTSKWKNPSILSSSDNCKADYFNINKLNLISFEIEPIKTGAAAVSFWFYSIKPEYSSEGIIHIVLSDFMICTIIVDSGIYNIYVTGYELYHEAYGHNLKDTKTKTEFLNAIQFFPYKHWYAKGNLNKLDRWIYIRFSFNYHKKEDDNTKITLILQYYKYVRSGSSNGNEFEKQYDKQIPNEYIYGTENSPTHEIHFKKFYRTNDKIFLKIINYGMDKQLYLKNLYVFATDLADSKKTDLYTLTKGFQYYSFEKIFNTNNNHFPELFFSCPLDSISFSIVNNNYRYTIPYYIYNNNGERSIKSTFVTLTENIDNSLYSYYSKLYRLNFITLKNNYYNTNDINKYEFIVPSSWVYFYFYETKIYAATTGFVNLNDMKHVNGCGTSYSIGDGLYTQTNGYCTYTCDLNCEIQKCPTDYFLLYNVCIEKENKYVTSIERGALYYSYFYNLPPIKINLDQEYDEYYLKFNFRFETNTFLRPGIAHKGKKIYILYTNSFKIWHDYHFTYLSIEDKDGNNWKNLRPYFNIDNKNTFTIKVYKKTGDSNYYGNIYLNNNLNHFVDFNAGNLKELYFCHNDSDCNFLTDPKNIYWTSGFYDHIKIYRKNNDLVNDDVIYNSRIYDDEFLYISISKSSPLYDQLFMDTTEIPLSFGYINNNEIQYFKNDKNRKVNDILSTLDTNSIQVYNYADKQEISIRKGVSSTNLYTGSDGNDKSCLKGKTCYGSGNSFSDECSICDESNNYFFRFSNCKELPTSSNNYYVLTFPFLYDYGFYSNNVTINLSPIKDDRFTFFFYLKLLGFPTKYGDNNNKRIIIGLGNVFIFYLISEKALFFYAYEKSEAKDFICRVEYPNSYFGKYIPISITHYKYLKSLNTNSEEGNYKRSFFSVQVNNKDYDTNSENRYYINVGSSKILLCPNEFYGTMANLKYYSQSIIGVYAFETNNQYSDTVNRPMGAITPSFTIIDGTKLKCISGYSFICIKDYDVQFNKDYYLSKKGFPNKMQVYTTKNDDYSHEDCHNNCGSFCYEKNNADSCACTNEGLFDYLEFSLNKVKCRKLQNFDLMRYKEVNFNNLPTSSNGGWGMWFFVHFNSYFRNVKSGYTRVQIHYCNGIMWFRPQEVECFNKRYIFNYLDQWIYFKFDKKYGKMYLNGYQDYISYEFTLTSNLKINKYNYDVSAGVFFIRQLQIWTDIDYMISGNVEIIDTTQRTGFGTVIDFIINNNYKITSGYLSSISYIETDNGFFGYYPEGIITISQPIFYNEYDNIGYDSYLLNKINDITIKKIPPSVTNSYSMEMWVRIQNPQNLLNGINAIWEKHVAISIVKNTVSDKLSFICFPQDYLNSPLGKKGREIFNLIASSFNSDKFEIDLTESNNKWIYMRCSFNWMNELYYLKSFNQKLNQIYFSEEKKVKKENTYENQKVDYPYKYFYCDSEYSKLTIQNAQIDGDTQININNIYLYNEYLLPGLNTLKVRFEYNSAISPLVFGIEFIKYTSSNQFYTFKQGTYEYISFSSSHTSNSIRGAFRGCYVNNYYYDSKNIKCIGLTSDNHNDMINRNAKYYDNINIFECKEGYYLYNNICYQNCPNGKNRSPGTSQNKGYCSYNIDTYHQTINTPLDYKTNLLCLDDYTNVGYKCFPTDSQENSVFYFNHCYNFLPAYQKFTDIIMAQTQNAYVVESWFKLDKVNEFCGNNLNRYVLWIYPHSLYQKSGSDIVYYKDLFLSNISTSYSPVELPNIHLYEWNIVMFEYRKSERKVNVWVNYKTIQPDHSFNIDNIYVVNDTYNVRAFAFCTGKHVCAPFYKIEDINWSAAYYSKIRVFNISSSSVNMILENGLNKVKYQPKNILKYYNFNTVDNGFNIIYDENFPNLINYAFNINDNLPSNTLYRVDDIILLYSSTTNYDWGAQNQGKYIINQEPITGKIISGYCSIHCKRCYSSSSNDCYECYEGYVLYYSECRERTGYYFQIPNIANNIVPNIKKNSFQITEYNPITITVWIKFFGIKYSNLATDINTNCVLIIQISKQNKVYLCYNTEYNHILIYYNDDTILFDDTLFPLESGKWALLSFSNYNSNFKDNDTTGYYPLMFSFSLNSYTIPRASTYNLPDPGIYIDTIILGTGISASISDIRIYNSFILNPYGIITNDESYEKLLVYNIKLYDNELIGCVPTFDLFDDNNNELSRDVTCVSDYNIYHDISNLNCNKNKNKRVNFLSLDNECVDCIEDCYYCGGISKLNCACYYNDIYWFRKYQPQGNLFCQKLPYIDFSIYKKIEYKDISYATTNEYAIEFWYFIYEYKNQNHIFREQSIQWTEHNEIIISKKDDSNVYVDCYPIHNHDNSVYTRDSSQGYYQWYHIICGTSLTKKLYYLNNLNVNSLNDSQTNSIDYSSYGNAKTRLIFKNFADHGSHGFLFIKELRLWSLYSIREFPTNCAYNVDYIKNIKDINFLLHYYPFIDRNNGIISDVKGNEPEIVEKRNDIIGYNIVDYDNLLSLLIDFEECLVVLTIPSFGYFNLTHFYISTYLKNPLSTDDLSSNPIYTFKFYISEDAKKKYSEINPGEFNAEGYDENLAPNEVLISKLTDQKFNNSDINVYVTERNPITGRIKIGFGRIKVIDFIRDINFEDYLDGLDDDLEVDSNDLSSKVILSENQIWSRIKTLASLGEIPSIAFTYVNMTDTNLIFTKKEENTFENYISSGINTVNPICSKEFCSNHGYCYIVVRSLHCKCDEGYSGTNCHLTKENKNYLKKLYNKFWNYLTNNNDLNILSSSEFTNEYIVKILYLVKTSTNFIENNSELIENFYLFFDFIEKNYPNLIADNFKEFILVFDYITISLFKEINNNRLDNYIAGTTTKNDLEQETKILSDINTRRLQYPEDLSDYTQNISYSTSLTEAQIKTSYEFSLKIIEYLKKVISKEIAEFKESLYLSYQGFDITVVPVTEQFNYTRFFTNKLVENQNNRFSYRSYIDASNCSSHIFKHTSYKNLFLIIIQYRYNPLSFYSIYSKSLSFLNDIFYMDEQGNIITLTNCENNYTIYFPLNLYNRTRLDLILTHIKFIFKNPSYSSKHPYVTWPVYVFDNGTVYNKSRELRIKEVCKLVNIDCTYYDSVLTVNSRYEEINYESNFFISCPVNHLSLFSLEAEDNNDKIKMAGLFFYITAYQVFQNFNNYSNYALYIYGGLFVIFFFGLIIVKCIDYDEFGKSSNLLDNIKSSIIKENSFYDNKEKINNDLNTVNKFYNQEEMIKELDVREKIEKIKRKKYKEKKERTSIEFDDNTNKKEKIFKRKRNIRFKSETELEGITERETQIENISKYKGNPPKKNNYQYTSYDKNNYINDNNKYRNKREDYIENVNVNDIYQVEDYQSDSDKKESSFGFISESSQSENKYIPNTNKNFKLKEREISNDDYNNNERINDFDNDNRKSEKYKIYNEDNPTDYLSKFTRTRLNNNYLEDSPLTIIKNFDTRIKIQDIFEDIEEQKISYKKFLKWCLIKRNIYFSFFSVNSSLNPKWKRWNIIYLYLILQYLFGVFYLTLVERVEKLNRYYKILAIHPCVLLTSNLTIYGIIWFFRVDDLSKKILLDTLKSSEQMKLISEWKKMKIRQNRKIYGGLFFFLIIFIGTFYIFFTYTVVMYKSKSTFILNYFTGILLDIIIYEGFMNFLLSILYVNRKNKDKMFKKFFLFRTFRNCL